MSSVRLLRLVINSAARRNIVPSTFVLKDNVSCISSNVNCVSRCIFSRRCYSSLEVRMSKKDASSSPQKTQSKLTGMFTKKSDSRPMSTGQGGSPGGKNTSPKNRGDNTTQTRVTRSKLEDEERKQVEKDREAALSMPLEEKRKRYKCGNRYVTLSDVETWKDQAKQEETTAATSPKKKKSSESKGPLKVLRDLLGWKSKNIKIDDGKTYDARDDLNQKVSIWRGDITTLEIDAIVNAANESLMGGGGVDGAIHSAAGMKLKKECARLHGCNTGEAKITSGYDLPAKYVIHTVGPIGEGERDLHSCYLESLKRMKENNLTSIAFPCISTGIYGYPNEKAAPLAMKTVREWLENDEYGVKVERVIFCLFLKVDVDLYNEGMKKFFPPVVDCTGENGSKNNKPDERKEADDRMETSEKEDKDAGKKASEKKEAADDKKPNERKEAGNRKESKMEVDIDESSKTEENKSVDPNSATDDVEMVDDKSGKDLSSKPDDKMEEEQGKEAKEACSIEEKNETKVKAKKGDNSNSEQGDNSEGDKVDNPEESKDSKSSANAKGDKENLKSSPGTKEKKKPVNRESHL